MRYSSELKWNITDIGGFCDVYRKEELRELDRRIRYLQKRLPDLTIIGRRADDDQVYFGAWVELETDSDIRVDVAGDTINYAVVSVSYG